MFAECRCVSGAAARAGDDQLRWPTLESRRKGRQRLRQVAWLLPDCLRGLSDLMGHPYFNFAHARLLQHAQLNLIPGWIGIARQCAIPWKATDRFPGEGAPGIWQPA